MTTWCGAVLLTAATSYSGIVRVLQWLVVALVFLFFLRVIRAVWVEVRPAGPRATRAERRLAAREQRQAVQEQRRAMKGAESRRHRLGLEVVEPADLGGRRFEVDGETTVGRSAGCGVSTAYDVYSSTVHARFFRRGEHIWVEDLGSTNGTFVNSERITKPVKLSKSDLVQVGGTVFEVTR